ncbi:MAG: ABC transporter permease [Lentisphaerae bacterium]|nr:ABC transporter permease [Lentisphaerota bacterium]
MFRLLKEIYQRRELLLILIARNLKVRYKNSALGFFWTLLGPLFMILIYATFASILKWDSGQPNYLQFLIVGLVVWQFLLMCLNDSLHAVVGNSNLVKRTVFPRIILPLSTVTANLVNFLLTLCVLTAYLLLTRIQMHNLGFLPVVLLTQFALCLGMALIIATANVFLRDTEHILSIVTLAWFFLSPIFYSMDLQLGQLSKISVWSMHWIAFINPMSGLLCAYRALFMSDNSVAVNHMLISFAVSWVLLLIGIVVFQRFQMKFGDEL